MIISLMFSKVPNVVLNGSGHKPQQQSFIRAPEIDLFAVKSAILKVGQTLAKHAGYSHTFPSSFRACDTYCSGFVAFSLLCLSERSRELNSR